MLPELLQWIPPTIIVGLILYLHRITRQDIKGLRGDMADLRIHVDTVIDNLSSRMGRLEKRMGRLEERMARLEGTLDVLREFFLRSGRGNAA